MTKTYRVYQVDSFTTERFRGNPAGVVSNADGLEDAQMQAIAREMNDSETAFVFSESEEQRDYDVHVRFFTPMCEVPICGHATVSRPLRSCDGATRTDALPHRPAHWRGHLTS